tara:strand:+ start:481 stop:633 length:153 start_codon:yes stop_codon:yes gene_type:complete
MATPLISIDSLLAESEFFVVLSVPSLSLMQPVSVNRQAMSYGDFWCMEAG